MVMKAGCKQIVDYMKKYYFYPLYARNTLQFPINPELRQSLEGRQIMLRMLLGAYGCSSVQNAFTWSKTPEKWNFWADRDIQLRSAFSKIKLEYKTVEKYA